jgi:hypothetical protein
MLRSKLFIFLFFCSRVALAQQVSWQQLQGKWYNADSVSGKTILAISDSSFLQMQLTNTANTEAAIKWKYQLSASVNTSFITFTNEQIGTTFSYSTMIKMGGRDTIKIQQLENKSEQLLLDGKIVRETSIHKATERWKTETRENTTLFFRMKDD